MKLTYLIIITMLLFTACSVDPDKRSDFIINSKQLTNYLESGKYKYTIFISHSNEGVMYLYSDSNWNVGDTLKIIKQ